MIENTISGDPTIGGEQAMLLVGRYRVVRQLGQGGMGSVWLAEDTQLDGKLFAIKMLPSILVSNKRAYNQLKAEALVSMNLVHPNIVTLRAFEENGGNPFLVMDYIEGETLDDYLAEKEVLPGDEMLRLLKPVAEALDYAHREGVVHRDVKPANVMIRKDGHPFILDFGIAREIQETMTRVTGKLSSGTLIYMSPEQLNGASPKKEQDIYSFAAMVYECLKGNPPFYRGAIEDQIKNREPEPLSGCVALSVVCGVMAGLAKNPEDRPKSCVSVLTDANFNAEKQSRGEAATAGNAVRAKRAVPLRRNVVPVAKQEQKVAGFNKVPAVLLLLCALGGGIWFAMRDGDRASQAGIPVSNANAPQPPVAEVGVSQPPVTNADSPVANGVGLSSSPGSKPPVVATEADVTEIAVAAKVCKERIGRIDDADGFKARKVALSDLLAQAVAYGQAKRWDKAAVGFTNYVEGCKALVALDGRRIADRERLDSERRAKDRKEAEEARSMALAASKRAEAAGAKKYAVETWNDAVEKWKRADVSFCEMRFPDAKAKFSALKGMFDSCVDEAQKAMRKESERRRTAENTRLAIDAFKAGRWAEAIRLSRNADRNDETIQFYLGFSHDHGFGVEKNVNAAVAWYRKSAEQGFRQAQNNLAIKYDTAYPQNLGVAKNDMEAAKWYRLAAELGSASSQFNLGRMYRDGRGVMRNDYEAVRLFRLAAGKSFAPAQYMLGLMYEEGRGVSRSVEEAKTLYRKAAEKGNEAAKSSLCRLERFENSQRATRNNESSSESGDVPWGSIISGLASGLLIGLGSAL